MDTITAFGVDDNQQSLPVRLLHYDEPILALKSNYGVFVDTHVELRRNAPNSLLKKPPGEGTGPTIHVDFRGNRVGRVPSHGERDVFKRAAKSIFTPEQD